MIGSGEGDERWSRIEKECVAVYYTDPGVIWRERKVERRRKRKKKKEWVLAIGTSTVCNVRVGCE